MSATVDISGLQKLLRELSERARLKTPQLLADEGRLLALEFIKSTPPRNPKQGERAVLNDLRRLFATSSEGFLDVVGAEAGTHNVEFWTQLKNGKVRNILHVSWDRLDPTGAGMKAFHRSQRNSRGRVPNRRYHSFRPEGRDTLHWQAAYMVAGSDFLRFAKEQQSHVGRMRAAWLPGWTKCRELSPGGEKPPRWVTRHLERGQPKGTVDVSHLKPTGGQMYLEFGNFAPGICRAAQRAIQWAIRKRKAALLRRIKHVMLTGKDERTNWVQNAEGAWN